MNHPTNSSRWLLGAIPTVLGLGVAWLGLRLIRNEKRILHRRLELQKVLGEKSRTARRRILLGD